MVTSLGEKNEQPPLWEMFTILHQLICARHDTKDFDTSVPHNTPQDFGTSIPN